MLLYEKINKLIEKKLNICYNKFVIVATRYTKRECWGHSLFWFIYIRFSIRNFRNSRKASKRIFIVSFSSTLHTSFTWG